MHQGSGIYSAAGETVWSIVPQPFGNHNGGRLQFGPDGMLYLGLGDGGGSFDPEGNGQGFFIVVFPDTGIVFLSWFTYDTERPADGVTAILGEPGHRWLTAQGPFAGGEAALDVFVSSGGVFDSALPAVGPPVKDGTITLTWQDCNAATLHYEITSLGISGDIPLQRIVTDRVPLCEALQ